MADSLIRHRKDGISIAHALRFRPHHRPPAHRQRQMEPSTMRMCYRSGLPTWISPRRNRSSRALREYVDRGLFGYASGRRPGTPGSDRGAPTAALQLEKCSRMRWSLSPGSWSATTPTCHAVLGRKGWAADPDAGLRAVPPCRRVGRRIYQEMELTREQDGRYLDRFRSLRGQHHRQDTRFLCAIRTTRWGASSHRSELEAMAEMCLRHNLHIISDEIHCDLIFSGFSTGPLRRCRPTSRRARSP